MPAVPDPRSVTLDEFDDHLRTVNNRDGRPYEEATIHAYVYPAKALDAWMTANGLDGGNCHRYLFFNGVALTEPKVIDRRVDFNRDGLSNFRRDRRDVRDEQGVQPQPGPRRHRASSWPWRAASQAGNVKTRG